MNVGIYLFEGVELLDFAGPYEVFTTASRVAAASDPQRPPAFAVSVPCRRPEGVRARAGLRLCGDFTLAAHPPLDLLIVPGGVVDGELARPEVLAWITAQARRVPVVASVCTGAFLLAAAGLLDGRRATTHWQDIDELRQRFPAVEVVADVRWLDQGSVVTSAGIAAGIDMSLHLVARLAGEELALRTARQMEYDWRRPGSGASP